MRFFATFRYQTKLSVEAYFTCSVYEVLFSLLDLFWSICWEHCSASHSTPKWFLFAKFRNV